MTAISLYAVSNNGWLPRYSNIDDVDGNSNGIDPRWPLCWIDLIFPYLNNSTACYACPLRPTDYDSGYSYGTYYYDNAHKNYIKTQVDYMVNGCGYGTGNKPFGPMTDLRGVLADTTMMASQVSPDTIMLVDAIRGSNYNSEAYLSYDPAKTPLNLEGNTGYEGVRSISISNHNYKSASIAFFDNHAETVTASTMMYEHGYEVYRSAPNYYHSATDNFGVQGDLSLSNTGGTQGYWTAAAGDNQ